MSKISFSTVQATMILEILEQNGLMATTDTERALGLLQPHIRENQPKTTRTRTKREPSEEDLVLNTIPLTSNCLARVWNSGWGGQCKRKRQSGKDFCGGCGTAKTRAKTRGGPNGSCQECSKYHGEEVIHTYNWEHFGRYVPGEITPSAKWLCQPTTPPQPETSTSSKDPDDPKVQKAQYIKYFDGKDLDEIIKAVNSADDADEELQESVDTVATTQDWWESYLSQRKQTDLFGSGSDSDDSDVEDEMPPKPPVDQVDESSKAEAEAEKKANAEAEKKAKVEAEKKANVEAEKKANAEAEKAKVEAEKAKVEAEKKAKVEAEKAKVEAEKAKVEAEKAKVEAEFDVDASDASNSECGSDSDVDDSDDDDDDEDNSAWATGGLMRDPATRTILGWVKETNQVYEVIRSNFGQGALWGIAEKKNGKMTPVKTSK